MLRSRSVGGSGTMSNRNNSEKQALRQAVTPKHNKNAPSHSRTMASVAPGRNRSGSRADQWLAVKKYKAIAARTSVVPRPGEGRTTWKMRDRSVHSRYILTTGIRRIWEEDSWSREKSTKA